MKHKHYEMIVAKAANMDLVVLIDNGRSDGWLFSSKFNHTNFNEELDYFLCLPQHKEACLHWLNGGEAQTRNEYSDLGWDTLLPFEGAWSKVSHFTCADILLRIKPKKEKRWIGTCKNFVTALNYPSIDECKDAVGNDNSWEFHEIEVEV